MTAMSVPATHTTRPSARVVQFTAAVLLAAAVAIALWAFAPWSSEHGSVAPARVPAFQQLHDNKLMPGQFNQVCAPAPGTRYC